MKLIIYIAAMAALLCSCRDSEAALAAMHTADSLMQTSPDSALVILNDIKPRALHSAEAKARYGLSKSMALDKNFVDTTDFNVLQPAIDYYLEQGPPDERLRTLYYQGRIYMNQGDDEAAMQSFFEAIDLKSEATDQRTVALALIAQGSLYEDMYQPLHYIDNNIEASKIFNLLGDDFSVIECLERVVNGASLTKNKQLADSALSVCDSLVKITPEGMGSYLSALIQKTVRFGTKDEIKGLISNYNIDDFSFHDAMTIIDGYTVIGEYNLALEEITNVECGTSVNDSMRYSAIAVDIYEHLGQYKEAYDWLYTFCLLSDNYNKNIFEQDLLFAENRYKLEVENLSVKQSRKNILLIYVFSVIFGVLIFAWLYNALRLAKTKRMMAEKDNENLLLQQRQAKLESDNLRMAIHNLEVEQEDLKALLAEHKQMPDNFRTVINERLELLNALLAKEITDENSYALPYEKWIERIQSNRDEFLASSKLALKASHPNFAAYMSGFSFTETEENYICLCAIGLRGKEIGEYIQIKGHYNISSGIRKKMGLDSSQTNLTLFIREKMAELDGTVSDY